MVKRMVCTQCGHVWHEDVLAQRGVTRCLFCSGELVDESPRSPDQNRPVGEDRDDVRGPD